MTNNTMVPQVGSNVIINRANKAVPDYNPIARFRVSINTPDCSWGDTSLTTNVPITGTETISDCSVITGWTASASDSLTVNTLTFKPDGGADGALNIVKAAVASDTFSVYKATTSIDGSSKDLLMWFYIKDSTAFTKLYNSGTAITVRLGSDASNYYSFEINPNTAGWTTGWNLIKKAIPSEATATTGTPVITALDYTMILVKTNNMTDTFVEGDLVFDAIRAASAGDYYKTVDTITLNETDASVTYVTTLTITEANGFLLNGFALTNDDASEKLIIKSKLPNNSKDTTDLFRYTTKIKLRNINQ